MFLGAAVLCVLGAGVQPVGRPVVRPGGQPVDKPAAEGKSVAAVKPPVPFPHPLITEVLFAVPTGSDGDANKDGERSATGDEFVELVNPHDKPIQLGGYVLTDGTALRKSDHSPNARTQVRFVFPELELAPGQVVVVFNGYRQSIGGPVGDSSKAPADPNPGFSGALVFSMKTPVQFVALNNDSDCVVLRDPTGRPVNAIGWGGHEKRLPPGTLLPEEAPTGLGSVQRYGLSRTLVPHPDAKPGVLFSPGEFDVSAEPPAVAKRSTPKAPAKQATKPEPEPKAVPAAGG